MKNIVSRYWSRGSELLQRRRFLSELASLKKSPQRGARIVFNMFPRMKAWGGGNQWLLQMTRSLVQHGFEVGFDLRGNEEVVIIIDSCFGPEASFPLEHLAISKRTNSKLRCLHRINENDLHRGISGVNERLARVNVIADHTVFVSDWLAKHHIDLGWFDAARDHSVILQGADPTLFFPRTAADNSGKCKIVTHHWSTNPLKGFDIYKKIDDAIASGKLDGFELHVIGRWPKSIQWKSARLTGPCHGDRLAQYLRESDLYVSASIAEPGPMHVVEALQCGLPVAFHSDAGGSIEYIKDAGMVFHNDNIVEVLIALRRDLQLYRNRAALSGLSGEKTCNEYVRVVENLLGESPALRQVS